MVDMNKNISYIVILKEKDKEKKKEKDVIKGYLHQISNEDLSIRELCFDPLTILCDLLDIVDVHTGEDSSRYLQDNYFFKENYRTHPFFRYTEFHTKIIPEALKLYEFIRFYNAVDELNKIFISKKSISLSRFEILKQFYGLEFTTKIEFKRENPVYSDEELRKYIKENKLHEKNNPDEQFQYEELGHDNQFDVKEIFELNETELTRFTYTCYSIEDIIFSVLHFLILYGYKFSKCIHCGKYFATTSFKQKYCKRKSPYKKSIELQSKSCQEAVKYIKKRFTRRKNTIDKNLKGYQEKMTINFQNEYYAHTEKIRLSPSIKNLEDFEQFISKENIKNYFYKKEQKINYKN